MVGSVFGASSMNPWNPPVLWQQSRLVEVLHPFMATMYHLLFGTSSIPAKQKSSQTVLHDNVFLGVPPSYWI